MTGPKTYWLVDRTGNKALVEGAAERDRWVPLGWAEAEEPTGDELVWASFDGVEQPAQFPHDIFREVWEPKGWTAAAPPRAALSLRASTIPTRSSATGSSRRAATSPWRLWT